MSKPGWPKPTVLFSACPRRIGWVLLASVALIAALALAFLPAGVGDVMAASQASVHSAAGVNASQGQGATPGQSTSGELSQRVYLPTINRYQPPRQSVFGVQILNGSGTTLSETAASAGVTWVRYGEIRWDWIEAVQGQRDWSLLASFDRDLAALQGKGLNSAVVVLGAPTWAQARPPWMCGAIRADALDDFASFMQALVRRYSGPPYYVKYWELGNEPDVDPALVGPDSGFGCWGDAGDAYYGGGAYASMLKTIYPAIKAADPQAKVMIGGLLMDCDPTHPPVGNMDGCLPGKFFEGILRGGGAPYFDIVAYHAYTHWENNGLDDDLIHPKWAARGGSLLGKANFLREVMARYGVNKPLLMNEGGLLCHPSNSSCPNDTLRHDQAAAVVKLYARTWANGIEGSIWYTLNGPGWREGGLLERGTTPRPAFNTLVFMANTLKSASFSRSITTAQMEHYIFEDSRQVYHLYWTNQANLKILVPVPFGTQAIYDLYGQPIANMGSTLQVSMDPVMFVLRK